MCIISLTWARNEEDILESFVRHNSAIVDEMIIVLHRCTDTSKDILERLQGEGLSINIREHDAPYHAQGEVLTELLADINKAIDSSVELRNKKELINQFIASLEVHSSVGHMINIPRDKKEI
jgi:hypothetical protein